MFFFHGTSIGTRRQGISYNVPTLLDSCELRNYIFSAKIIIIAKTNVDATKIFAIARNGC